MKLDRFLGIEGPEGPDLNCSILPLLAAFAPAIVGGIGSGIAAATGAGKSDFKATPFSQTPDYNPHAFKYHGGYDPVTGKPLDAAGASRRLQQEARAASTREAIKADLGRTYSQGVYDDEARAAQFGMLDTLKQAGEYGSAEALMAENQMREGLSMANANAMANAAATRGGGGNMALAMRSANRQSGLMGMDANVAAARMRAESMLNARRDAIGLMGTIRNQQQGRMGLEGGLAMDQANLAMQGRALNDQTALAYEGLAQNPAQQQLNASIHQQEILANSRRGVDQTNADTAQSNAGVDRRNFEQAMGAISGAASAGLGVATSSRKSSPSTPKGGDYPDSGSGGHGYKGGDYSDSGSGGYGYKKRF